MCEAGEGEGKGGGDCGVPYICIILGVFCVLSLWFLSLFRAVVRLCFTVPCVLIKKSQPSCLVVPLLWAQAWG